MPNLGPISLNFTTVLLGLGALALVVWSVQEYREAESAREAGKGVGERVAHTTGGVVGFLSALLVGVVAGLHEAGMELAEFGTVVGDVVATSPQAVMGAITALLGALGISGTLDIAAHTYIGLAIVLLGVGVIIADRTRGSVS